MSESITVEALIKKVLFAKNGTHILNVEVDNRSETVKGQIDVPYQVGDVMRMTLRSTQHQKYGKQYSIVAAPALPDAERGSDEWIEHYYQLTLASSAASVRPKIEQVWEKGIAAWKDAMHDPSILHNQYGFTVLLAQMVKSKWDNLTVHLGLNQVLIKCGLKKDVLKSLILHFKDPDKMHSELQKNPYRICEIEGVNLYAADTLSKSLETYRPEPWHKPYGAVLTILYQHLSNGNLVMTDNACSNALMELGIHVPIPKSELQNSGAITILSQSEFGLAKPLEIEENCASLLRRRMRTAKSKYTEPEISNAIDIIGQALSINLSEMQREGVIKAMTQPVTIITGLPGTGKTTSLRMLVRILEDYEIKFELAAPTGIAAKRISVVTGTAAGTIHRVLGARADKDSESESDITTYSGIVEKAETKSGGDGMNWKYGRDNPLPADVLIVDETSMLDQNILHQILISTKPTARLVFVGDPAQLPSVGPGNILFDMIRSNYFPSVHLTEIFRQEDTSDIVRAAHAINAGEYPNFPNSKEFHFMQVADERAAFTNIIHLASELHKREVGFQILSPRHGGITGVTNLNNHLREQFNPSSPGIREVAIFKEVLRERDRVMVTKNEYEYGIFNGDIGKIISIEDKTIKLRIHGSPDIEVDLPSNKVLSLIRLAYAITVHKFQGMEQDVIIVPVLNNYHLQLQRNLYYTAITRARKKVILIGHNAALARSIGNVSGMYRQTRLEKLISG